MLERLYQKLWTKVGGRPWTDIIRDDQKKEPLVYLIILFLMGIGVTKLVGKRWWWIVLALSFGILLGHFWW